MASRTGLDFGWLRQLSAQLLERSDAERPQWLETHCPDPHLRRVLETTFAGRTVADLEPGGALGGALWADLLAALDPGTGEGSTTAAGALAGGRVGRLSIERLLEAGGMGEVYEAWDALLERKVAVKTLRPDHDVAPQARARFLREARILSQLDHPNVCRLYDLVEHAGGEALVLELLAGETLKARLAREPRPTAEEALVIAAGIAAGLAAAHQAGVIHRDLKPSNVMLGAEGVVKLIDFGIARRETLEAGAGAPAGESAPAAAPFETQRGSTVGTPAYMSPEQARGAAPTPATDVYSLGILLVELFTGRDAYGARNAVELIERVRRAAVAPLGDAPVGLRELLGRMLAADPADRPPIAEVEARLLELAGEPERAARRRRQRRWAAVVLAGLLLAGGLAAWLLRPEPLLDLGRPVRLAVLPFENRTGQESLDWTERGLAEMVGDNLATVHGLTVIPTRDVVEMLRQKVVGVPSDRDELKAILAGLGANVALVAEVEAGTEPGAFRLRYRAERPGIEARTRTLEGDDLLAAANELSARLTRRLAPDALLPDLRERFSEVPMANQLHAMGLQRLRQENGTSASPFFRVVKELDTGFLDASLRLGEALALQADWAGAAAEVEPLIESARRQGHEDLAGEAYTVLANAAHGRDAREEAARWGEQAVASAERSGNRQGLAAAHHALGRSLRFLDPPRGRAHFESALELYRELGHRLGEAKALHGLGVMADEAGDEAGAGARFTEALAIARELGALRLEAIVLDSQAIVLGRTDAAGAAGLLARAVALHRRSGDRRALLFSLGNLGDAEHEQGHLDAAEAIFREADGLCGEIDVPVPCALLAFNFAELLLKTGRPAEALPLIERSEAVYGADDTDLLFTRAMYQAATGRIAAGRRILARAMAGTTPEKAREYALGFDEAIAAGRSRE